MQIIDNINMTVKGDLQAGIKKGSRLSVAAACFSIYAYQELKKQLESIDELRFIFTSPTFVTEKASKAQREFYIPRISRESSLYGTEFEVNATTEAAIDSINKILRDSGFQGFSIRAKDGVENVYEIVRENGTVAENLSEGERNFIAFLYFYHRVRGSMNSEELKEKIVVIDDPVSSMDSTALFIVSAIVREMINVCRNNTEYLNPQVPGDYIKQLFILTQCVFPPGGYISAGRVLQLHIVLYDS